MIKFSVKTLDLFLNLYYEMKEDRWSCSRTLQLEL